MNVSPIPTTRIDKDHLKDQIIRDLNSAIQARRMTKISDEHAMRQCKRSFCNLNFKRFRLLWIYLMARAIRTKWVFRNKKDEIGIVIRNKARLVAQGYIQEEGIDYDKMDMKSAFLYGTIEEEMAIEEGTRDDFVHQEGQCDFSVSTSAKLHDISLGLQVMQKDDEIFISQDKYVADILKKFDFVTVNITSTPIKTNKALLKDEEANDVDVHLYRLMIRSLMYLIAFRPDIMFVVCACARFQVTPKTSHIYAVNRIFRYLKGQPKLDLWYPRDSPFNLEAFSDSDYAGASLDRKSITGVANSTTEATYVAAANCYGHVLWIQNQMFNYGFNFMISKIYIDNEITICIVKNPVFHSKTKHIEIRHHFIRDSYEKKLIQVIKIRTYHNVANLLTKAFDEDKMERAATTASSLEAEQDIGNINRTQSMATLNESFPQGNNSGSGLRCQVTILGLQMLKLGLRLHLNSPMIYLSQELTHLEVGRIV
ncbi:putative ribonuclease H-like domain-containing protein [Tanacetum coccineum]